MVAGQVILGERLGVGRGTGISIGNPSPRGTLLLTSFSSCVTVGMLLLPLSSVVLTSWNMGALSSGALAGANLVFVLFFFFLFLGGLSLSYHSLPVSSSSGIVSIGVLLLVWR